MKINKDFKFKKAFGQNFLTDKNLLNAIVKDSGVTENDEVLEIGAGAGALTEAISLVCKKVVSFEIDKMLTEFLAEKFKDVSKVEIIMSDALKTPIKEIESHFLQDYYLIANLPYYITTPLIFKFLEETNRVKCITIMVQKEVAEKIIAKENSENYGILSVMVQNYCNVKITRIVRKEMFNPRPKVDSAIVRLERKSDVLFNKQFTEFVKKCFAMRRKTLLNNLVQAGFQKEKLLKIFHDNNLEENVRAECLNLDNFQKIFADLDK